MGLQIFARLLPSSVEISPSNIAPKVAIEHTIDVDHRKDLKGVSAQYLQTPWTFDQLPHQVLAHIGGPCLSRMLATGNDYNWFVPAAVAR